MEALLAKISLGITLGLQVVVLYLLFKQHLQRRVPLFLTYIIYELCETALRLAVAGNRPAYYKVYWLTAIGGAILSVLAFRESFINVFREYTRLRWFVWLLWGCVGLALLYSLAKAWFLPPVRTVRLGTVIVALEMAVDYCLAAVGILYFALLLFFGIKQHQWETGIISGFTIDASLEVFGLLVRSAFGAKFPVFNQWIPAVAYILGEVEWVVALARPERKVKEPIRNLHIDDPGKMDQYMKILRRFFGRGA